MSQLMLCRTTACAREVARTAEVGAEAADSRVRDACSVLFVKRAHRRMASSNSEGKLPRIPSDGARIDGKGIIYKLISPSGKAYVGQTTQALATRVGNHRCVSRCRAIHAAIKKYGIGSFKVEVLASGVDIEDLDNVEGQLIQMHNTLNPNGYNLVPGRIETGSKTERYMKLKNVMKIAANKPSFVDHKKELWSDPEWAEAWRATWMKKREAALEELDGRERELRILSNKRNDRAVAKRKAMKDPEKKAEWESHYSRDAILERRRRRNIDARVAKMSTMSNTDAAAYSLRAFQLARDRHIRENKEEGEGNLHLRFHNVFTRSEIQALQANGGVWPS